MDEEDAVFDAEKKPLLESGNHAKADDHDQKKEGFPLVLFFVGLTGFSQLFGVGIAVYDLQQYGYYRFQRIEFPNVTFNNSIGGEDPLCHKEINTSSFEYYVEQTTQKLNADWSIYNSITSGVPILFMSLILPPLSDKYGRRPMIPIPLIGTILGSLLTAAAIHWEWNMYVITGLALVAPLFGGWITSLALLFAYCADITSGKSRTFAIAIIEILCGGGFLVSVFISGFLIKSYGFVIPLLTTAGVALITLIIVLLFVPESLKKENIPKDYDIFKQIKSSMDFYTKKRVDKTSTTSMRWKYILCITAFSLFSLGTLGRGSAEILYQLGPPFCWDSVQISTWTTVRTLVQEFVGIGSIKLMQCCLDDAPIAVIGGLSGVAYFLMEGLARNTDEMYIVIAVGCLGLVPVSVLRSIMSKMTPVHLQGSLFAGIAWFECVWVMIGSVICSAIYSATVDFMRSFTFYFQAGISLISVLACVFIILGPKEKSVYSKTIYVNTEEEKNLNGTVAVDNRTNAKNSEC